MKLLLVAGLLLSSAPVFAQVTASAESAVPFKGANVIAIKTPDAAGSALKKLAEALKAQGYEVDSLTGQKLTTIPRAYDFKRYGIITPVVHKFRATASGSAIEITGVAKGKLNPTQEFETKMAWYGEKDDSQNKACFAQAQKIALAYPGGKVEYLRKP